MNKNKIIYDADDYQIFFSSFNNHLVNDNVLLKKIEYPLNLAPLITRNILLHLTKEEYFKLYWGYKDQNFIIRKKYFKIIVDDNEVKLKVYYSNYAYKIKNKKTTKNCLFFKIGISIYY